MKYTQSRFTLPAGSPKITQEQWDAAFYPNIGTTPCGHDPAVIYAHCEACHANAHYAIRTHNRVPAK